MVRDDPDRVRASQRTRGADENLVDALLAADDARRAAVSRADALRAEQKSLGRDVAKAGSDERPTLLTKARHLADEVKSAEADQAAADEALREAHLAIPNVVEDGVPAGGEDDFVTLETVGTPPQIDDPKDHLEIGSALKAIDTERGAKVSGARFYFLTGVGAQLEFALINLAMAQATRGRLRPHHRARPGEARDHAGHRLPRRPRRRGLPPGRRRPVPRRDVGGRARRLSLRRDPRAELPLRYAGFSSCFRREAGSYGKDTKGIIRVHWFDKVEMFSYVGVDEARDEHQRLLAWEREFLDKLELAYRVIDVAAGDLGSSAARKFDIEAWFPSQSAYRELTSTSNCTTFQSRRLNIRTRGDSGNEPVATLNGTLCAVARTIACLLDHHQQPDGSVYVPAALRPYLGGREVLTPA